MNEKGQQMPYVRVILAPFNPYTKRLYVTFVTVSHDQYCD